MACAFRRRCKKNEPRAIFARGSIRSVTLVIGLGKPPGRRAGKATQPFPSFKLKGALGKIGHPPYRGSGVLVRRSTRRDYHPVLGSGHSRNTCTIEIGRGQRTGCSGSLATTALPICVPGAFVQLSL